MKNYKNQTKLAGAVTYENGYVVVDLKGVWEGKNIEPGQSYKFRLAGTENIEDISAIESIELVQRMNEKGTELGRQMIFKK